MPGVREQRLPIARRRLAAHAAGIGRNDSMMRSYALPVLVLSFGGARARCADTAFDRQDLRIRNERRRLALAASLDACVDHEPAQRVLPSDFFIFRSN
jgi:hypothetical protein